MFTANELVRELTCDEVDVVAGGIRAISYVPAPSFGTVPWFEVGFNPGNGQYVPPQVPLPPR